MAYNLQVGLMATTTVVGSAVAFTKTQAGVGEMRGSRYENQSSGQEKTKAGGDGTRGPGYKNQSSGQAKTQAGWDGMRGPGYKNKSNGQDWTGEYTESSGSSQKQGEGANYKDTFHQMMMWK